MKIDECYGRARAIASEVLTNIRTTQSLNAQEQDLARYGDAVIEAKNEARFWNVRNSLLESIAQCVFWVVFPLGIWYLI